VTGTTENDLFVLNTALNVAAFGSNGNDTFTAAAVNGTNGTLNGGQGNDTISLTAGVATLALSKVFAGGGNDRIAVDAGAASNTTLNGGGGDDFIQLSGGTYASTTINGNQGADTITASASILSAAFIGFGGGDDRFVLQSAQVGSSTIALGGGADVMSATINNASAMRIEGDTVGDTVFFGNDSIRIGGTTLGSAALVQGGGGADLLAISAGLVLTSTINGNAGADSIVLSAIVAGGSGTFVGGGAGADSIQVSAALANASATIQGGGGSDVISVSGSLAATGSLNIILGGADADTIGLGTNFSGTITNVGFAADDSIVGAFDTVSANAGTNATYTISQSAFSFASGQSLANGDFTTNTGGIVTYINADANTLTARAAQMDEYLTVGQTVIFQAAGANYIFSQAGGTSSGTADDLVFQVTNTFTAAATSGGLAGGANNSSYTVTVA
jgi:hypothetical protein